MRRRVAAAARQLASRTSLRPTAPLALPCLTAAHAHSGAAAAPPHWPPLLPAAAQALAASGTQRRFAHGRGGGEEAVQSSGSTSPSPPPDAGREARGESPAYDDAPPRSWLDDALPARAVPFAKLARLDAPAGTLLLLAPCAWSIALAAPAGALPDLQLLALFSLGAVLLRGAGCTVNDLWDRDIDARVARTRHRPLACGAVTPAGALVFLGAQLGVGLGVLLQLNTFAQVLGASSLGLVATYPLMKRITNWPQAFLGLTFNWGALLVRLLTASHVVSATPLCSLRVRSHPWCLYFRRAGRRRAASWTWRLWARCTRLACAGRLCMTPSTRTRTRRTTCAWACALRRCTSARRRRNGWQASAAAWWRASLPAASQRARGLFSTPASASPASTLRIRRVLSIGAVLLVRSADVGSHESRRLPPWTCRAEATVQPSSAPTLRLAGSSSSRSWQTSSRTCQQPERSCTLNKALCVVFISATRRPFARSAPALPSCRGRAFHEASQKAQLRGREAG